MLEDRTRKEHTDDHCGELEAFPHAFPVNLVWKIGKTDVAHQFFTNDGRNARSVTGWNQRRTGAIRKAIVGDIWSASGGVRVGHLEGMIRNRTRRREEKGKKYF